MSRKKALYSAAVLLINVLAGFNAQAKDAQINALWNDNDGFGIWVSEIPRSCGEGYTSVKPLIVISPSLKPDRNTEAHTVDLGAPKLCLYFSDRSPLPEKCLSGTATYRYDKERNHYVGELSLNLRGGKKATQHFRAEYCKPSG